MNETALAVFMIIGLQEANAAKEIATNLPQIGHPDYPKRATAYHTLKKISGSELFYPMLEKPMFSIKHSKDQEVARRAKKLWRIVVSKRKNAWLQKLLQIQPTLPWIDMLPLDFPYRSNYIEIFLTKGREKIGRKGPPIWEDYRLATKLFLKSYLNSKSTLEAGEILNRMVDRENQWIAQNGKNYSPPLICHPYKIFK